MKKILNVIGKRPTGGIGSVVYNYQSHFTSENLKIDYLLFADEKGGAFDEKVKCLGSNVYVLPELRNDRLFLLWKKMDAFMKKYGKEYDAIHLHSVNIGFMCFPIARKYGVKHLITHSHATIYSDKKINAIRNRILCINLLRQANIYMACSKAAAEFLYGKEKMDQVHIYNNAIECKKFAFSNQTRDEVRKNLGLENQFVVGHVGRFDKQKNHTFLLQIFKQLVDVKKNAILLLIGEGPLKNQIYEEVLNKNLTNKVIFLGQRNDVPELLQAMDVFVLPSLFEGLPVIGIEAQASGLPCVVADTVTRELRIRNVEYVSLQESPSVWTKNILNMKHIEDREKEYKLVAEAGYDIEKEALKLQEFYLNLD